MHKMKCLYFPSFKRFFSNIGNKIVIQLDLFSYTAIINVINTLVKRTFPVVVAALQSLEDDKDEKASQCLAEILRFEFCCGTHFKLYSSLN